MGATTTTALTRTTSPSGDELTKKPIVTVSPLMIGGESLFDSLFAPPTLASGWQKADASMSGVPSFVDTLMESFFGTMGGGTLLSGMNRFGTHLSSNIFDPLFERKAPCPGRKGRLCDFMDLQANSLFAHEEVEKTLGKRYGSFVPLLERLSTIEPDVYFHQDDGLIATKDTGPGDSRIRTAYQCDPSGQSSVFSMCMSLKLNEDEMSGMTATRNRGTLGGLSGLSGMPPMITSSTAPRGFVEGEVDDDGKPISESTLETAPSHMALSSGLGEIDPRGFRSADTPHPGTV